MKLRKAKIPDVPQIYKLINFYANKRLMLPRALSEIYEHLQEFFVIEYKKKIIGCVALHVTWEDLAEIKSLAISPKFRKKGLGSKLLKRCHKEAKQLGVKRIFALSFVPEFFKKHKYRVVKRDTLPHKIWMECVKCPYFPNCKEVPLIREID